MIILVTGASGFIGSRLLTLSKECLAQGDEFVLLTSREVPGFRCVVHNGFTYSAADFFKSGIRRIDSVIHIGHYLAEHHPGQDVCRGNLSAVNHTVHLVENLPNIPSAFVYCSSMAVYGLNRQEALDEKSMLMPENPYAVSKIMCEMLLDEWAEKNGVKLHILRLAHIYGPNDRRKYSIPVWLQAAGNGQPIRLSVNPDMKRNCLYIDDCCRFLLRAAYMEQDVKVINATSSHNATMYEIASLCKKISANPHDVEIQPTENSDVGLAFADSGLCKNCLGLENVCLEEGLRREYEYYTGTS